MTELIRQLQPGSVSTRWTRAMLSVMATIAATVAPFHVAAFGDGQRDGARIECMKRHSRAWCVLDAADMSLKLVEIRRERLDATLKESGLSAADIAFSAGVASGLLPAPKFGAKWTDLSMVVLSVLTEKKPAVLGYNKVIGWMPFDMAPTADDADELLANMIHRATREALKEYSFQPATFPANPKRARTLQNSDQSGWLLSGPNCRPGQCRLWNQRTRNSFTEPPKEGQAPEWLGGYKAWVFGLKSGPSIHEFWTGDAYESVRYASALSKVLPEWAFLSLTPEHTMPGGPNAQAVVLNPGLRMPLVMNTGQTWLPVFPEVDLKAEGGGK